LPSTSLSSSREWSKSTKTGAATSSERKPNRTDPSSQSRASRWTRATERDGKCRTQRTRYFANRVEDLKTAGATELMSAGGARGGSCRSCLVADPTPGRAKYTTSQNVCTPRKRTNADFFLAS
jgi:hypothetical protein